MDIKNIENLDIGVGGIIVEGETTYVNVPRHIEGDNEKGHYNFWSQFVVIDDGTGNIGCNVSFNKEEYRLTEGVIAKVKGRLEEYEDKNGEIQRSLRCSLVGVSEKEKTTDVKQKTAEKYFEDKAKEREETSTKEPSKNVSKENDLHIVRECAIKAVTELAKVDPSKGNFKIKISTKKDFFGFADEIVDYIYEGLQKEEAAVKAKAEDGVPLNKEEKIGLARHIVGGKKLELREGHTGLLEDEEEKIIDDEDLPGSSYDNSIPWKGKEGGLKKAEKAEGLIVEEDILPE